MEEEGEEEVGKFGRSIIVPSVQELAKESDSISRSIPSRYVRDNLDCPIIDQPSSLSVPVIDLSKLLHGESMDSELANLHLACKEWGFFQVINHGVSSSMLETFKEEVIKFFQLSIEEKKKLWQQPDDQEGFGQLFVVSDDQKLDWCDMFFVTTIPHTSRRHELFNKLPQSIRVILEAYIEETKNLAQVLLNKMAKALGIDDMEMKEILNVGVQYMRMNYFPPCPEPNKAIGLTPHSDPNVLTIVFQINETQGLQIRKDGNWIPVIPLKNAFVVNIGDAMEIISNGMYRSIEHRVTVNSTKERLSIAAFHYSNLDSKIGPAKSIIGPLCPPIFRTESMAQYRKKFLAKQLYGKSNLEDMRIQGELNTASL